MRLFVYYFCFPFRPLVVILVRQSHYYDWTKLVWKCQPLRWVLFFSYFLFPDFTLFALRENARKIKFILWYLVSVLKSFGLSINYTSRTLPFNKGSFEKISHSENTTNCEYYTTYSLTTTWPKKNLILKCWWRFYLIFKYKILDWAVTQLKLNFRLSCYPIEIKS